MGQLVSDFSYLFLVEGFSHGVGSLDSLLVPFLSSVSSLTFKLINEVLLAPSDLTGEVSQLAELSEAAQLYSSQSIRNDLSFFSIIRSGDSLEDFESAQGSGADGDLVWQHTSDGSPYHSGWSSVVDVSSSGVG